MTVNEITELLIENMKSKIDTLQKEAVDASKAGDMKACAEKLRSIEAVIYDLIGTVEAYNKGKRSS